MPHLTLEYTANLSAPNDLEALFRRLHGILHQQGGIRLENCKSRARKVDQFCIADGDKHGAFVHLEIRFMAGRSAGVKQSIGEAALATLLESFQADDPDSLQITVEIRDIEQQSYFKHPEGTLTPQKRG